MAKPPHQHRGSQPQAQQQRVTQQVQWTGPLPPPDALDKFNQIIPNGADRILKMAESEQAHRIEYEKAGVLATAREARRGQYLGAAISLAAIVAAAVSAGMGAHWAVSVAFVGVPVLGLVRAIVRPRN